MIVISDKKPTRMLDDRGRILWVRTAAGPKAGFGHLRRCLTLVRSLQEFCTSFFLLDRDDIWSAEQLSAEGFDFRHFRHGGLVEAWSAAPRPCAILIDTRVEAGLKKLMVTARQKGIPVISIHDLGLNPLPSDAVIDGSISALQEDAPFRGGLRYLGPEFMVLDPCYRRLHEHRKEIRPAIRSVFINAGGGDSERFYLKILEGLKTWAVGDVEVIGAPGFVPGVRSSIEARDWTPLRFRFQSSGIDIALFSADLAITAGGIAAYEALCVGTPLAAFSYDKLQQATVSSLAGLGSCLDLGAGEALGNSSLCETLAQLDADRQMRKRLSSRGKELVDGRGVERVSQIIRQFIDIHPVPEYGRHSDVSSAGV